jgi:hypothetical protein
MNSRIAKMCNYKTQTPLVLLKRHREAPDGSMIGINNHRLKEDRPLAKDN